MKERIEMMRNFFVRDKKQKESRIDNDFSFPVFHVFLPHKLLFT